MKTALIIEDELSGIEILEFLISEHCSNLEVLTSTRSVKEGARLINSLEPDIVFLDVEMPTGTGFDVLEQVDHTRFQVIFTTAYQQYAIKAIKYSALDYLLKPINAKDLVRAVDQALEVSQKETENKRINHLLRQVRLVGQEQDLVKIPFSNGFELVRAANILYCKSEGSYTRIFFNNRPPMLASKNIKMFEDVLERSGFMRIHKSHIINLAEVRQYLKGKGGAVVISDNTQLEVSRSRKKELLDWVDSI